jgi:hypothetical protein
MRLHSSLYASERRRRIRNHIYICNSNDGEALGAKKTVPRFVRAVTPLKIV